HKAVVVEGSAPVLAMKRAIQPVTIARRDSDMVVLEASLDAPAIIVLTDAYDAGWKVTVDGQSADLLRANAMFRGVGVAAGQHVIVFRYQPAPVLWGGSASIVGWVVLIMVAVAVGTGVVPSARPRPLFSSKPGRNMLR
ncbi:MAG TPA: YfhO family protein, partial [Roseiflexaceae bacterium]|nr:YfhO family protein [Roseiflexaceae bacterium]